MASKHQIITTTYEVYVDGKLFETVSDDRPLVFCTNAEMLMPKFEEIITTYGEDENYDFTIEPKDAYGERNEGLVFDIEKSKMTINGKFDEKVVHEGAVVPLLTQDGGRVNGIVVSVSESNVRIDLNSPFAGKTLRYIGKIHSKRDANEEEVKFFTEQPQHGCKGGCNGGNCGGDCGCEDGNKCSEGGCCGGC